MTLYTTGPDQAEPQPNQEPWYDREDVQLRELSEAELNELFDHCEPGHENDPEPGFDIEKFYWCSDCHRVAKGGSLYLSGGEIFCAFPGCSAPGCCLFRYGGWLRLALKNWKDQPTEGEKFVFLEGPLEPTSDYDMVPVSSPTTAAQPTSATQPENPPTGADAVTPTQ